MPTPSASVIAIALKKTGRQISDTPTSTGVWNSIASAATTTPSGATIDDMPSTPSTLRMLLPTTLPTARSRFPLRTAASDAASSGSEVPIATTVRPITRSVMPASFASSTQP
ncbi:MAG: hypothetical protein AAF596_05370 [Planctomycetota bacterium]